MEPQDDEYRNPYEGRICNPMCPPWEGDPDKWYLPERDDSEPELWEDDYDDAD